MTAAQPSVGANLPPHMECGGKRSATPLWLPRPPGAEKPKRRRRCALPAHSISAERQRRSASKPRVGAKRLPWVNRTNSPQPQRGCAPMRALGRIPVGIRCKFNVGSSTLEVRRSERRTSNVQRPTSNVEIHSLSPLGERVRVRGYGAHWCPACPLTPALSPDGGEGVTQGSLRQPWAGGRNAVGVLRVGRVAPRAPLPPRQTARAERRALPAQTARAERRALPAFGLRISFGFRASDFGFEP